MYFSMLCYLAGFLSGPITCLLGSSYRDMTEHFYPCLIIISLQDSDIYGEARSLYNEITSGGESSPVVADITKRLGEVGPVMSALGNAAAKLLE